MRRIAHLATIGCLFLGAVQVCLAGGDETGAIIDKAIKAHGFKGKEDKNFAYTGKNKGTLHIMGLDLDFTQNVSLQLPAKFKEEMQLSIMGNNVMVTTVFNGKDAWIKANGMDIDITKELMEEMKETAHALQLSQGLFLKDKDLKLTPLGEVKVKGKPAVGVQVAKKGFRDISFYFDKDTGLIAKMDRQAFDPTSGQLINEERIITQYQDADGRKMAKKIEVVRDGKPFMEAEVLEAHILDKIDDSAFRKPD
jgi:hypothetical protein